MQIIHQNFDALYLEVLYSSSTLSSAMDFARKGDNAATLAHMNRGSLQPAISSDPVFSFQNHICGGDNFGLLSENRMKCTFSVCQEPSKPETGWLLLHEEEPHAIQHCLLLPQECH